MTTTNATLMRASFEAEQMARALRGLQQEAARALEDLERGVSNAATGISQQHMREIQKAAGALEALGLIVLAGVDDDERDAVSDMWVEAIAAGAAF